MSLALVSEARSIESAIPIGSDFDIDQKRGGRILIVDDSRLIRSVVSSKLSGTYDCMQAESYSEAVEILKIYPFDLIIADVIMPGLSGIELLRKVIEKYPDTSVIMLSGVDRPQRALDALRLGAFDYLIKPCEGTVLELTVERAFERRAFDRDAKKYKKVLELRNEELEKGKAELQRLQSQLVQNEKMAGLGRIAAGIAHEINNPVGFIHGNLDILHQVVTSLTGLVEFYESSDLQPEIAARASEIKANSPYLNSIMDLSSIITDCQEGAARIKDIVQNLRTFSRLDEAECKKTDINAGIDSTIRLLSQYFKNGNITLERNYGDLPLIDAFGSQINQVWMNLLVNAAQAIGEDKGLVRITTRSDGNFVTVTVADTGEGMATQRLDLIFDPFYTTKSVGEGTGLGLSICYGIVEGHGGVILAASQLGAGAAFTVRLPIRMEAKPRAAETSVTIFEPVRPAMEIHA